LEFEEVVGLDVGTRPDCVPEEVLELLASYREKGLEVWLELGLQSANYETLKRINRAHGVSDFVDAVLRAKRRGLLVCAHTIVGLPGEGREDFIETAKLISSLPVDGIKIHPIYVMRNTGLAKLYLSGSFRTLSLEEYARFCADMLEHTREDIVVHRLTAEAQKDALLSPEWCVYERKLEVITAIEEELKRRKSAQGRLARVEGTIGNAEKLVESPARA
ncbi:MAG: TIGR01212 family radical SAM protein, partial [Aquificae bacterium]|nr:TIGR01212 family radical SAM protein [Aquificota bacterium]